MAPERPAGEQHRHHHRACRRRGPQRPQPFHANMQHIAGIDRQHRGRPAQQHGKQIKADRAQQHLVVADIGNALHQRAPRREHRWRRARHRPDDHQADEGEGEQDGSHHIGRGWRHRIKKGTQRRAQHRAGLPADAVQRDGLRQQFARHQVGGECGHRRPLEGAAHTKQGGDHEQRQHRHVTGKRQPAEDPGAADFQCDGGAGDITPVHPIGDYADHKRQAE